MSLEECLRRIGYSLQRALLVVVLQAPRRVRQKEIINSKSSPLDDVNEFVKAESLIELGLQGEEHVLKCYPAHRHCGHRLKFRNAHRGNRGERDTGNGYRSSALQK